VRQPFPKALAGICAHIHSSQQKTNRTVGKLFLILDAPLRHLDDVPHNDLAHSTGIGGPGTLASRPKQPVLGLIEGRTKDSDRFGIEGCLRPD
jgi:hypothetical protein